MLALLMLASISRCASAELCPSDEEITAAVRAHDDETISAIMDQAQREDPGSLMLAHTERIRGVRDVICGGRLPGERLSTTCKYTVRYWTKDSFEVARMVKTDGGWKIDQALSVARNRR